MSILQARKKEVSQTTVAPSNVDIITSHEKLNDRCIQLVAELQSSSNPSDVLSFCLSASAKLVNRSSS
jgi:hypothetical protein